jgi:hypothetical protein
MAQFTTVLDQHADGNKPLIDFPSSMTRLTIGVYICLYVYMYNFVYAYLYIYKYIDFISTAMFDGDFQTINSEDSHVETDGEIYLVNLPMTIKVCS